MTLTKRYAARSVLVLMLLGLAIIDWDNPGCDDFAGRTDMTINQRR